MAIAIRHSCTNCGCNPKLADIETQKSFCDIGLTPTKNTIKYVKLIVWNFHFLSAVMLKVKHNQSQIWPNVLLSYSTNNKKGVHRFGHISYHQAILPINWNLYAGYRIGTRRHQFLFWEDIIFCTKMMNFRYNYTVLLLANW